MANRTFHVKAVWDAEDNLFYAESDIIGLHVEAATMAEFEAVVMDVAPELIVANHLSASDLANRPLRDLVPAIVFEKPLAKAS
ncbi:DUF1902 domain-containing protein [Devosia sp. ZB163]|uniref:DUF1902 domain-containing protein n=1 Tax=Devosia sp. ZB163 TaxID=3025938 RepID=UPI0023609E04|nr:DUF1902 domain-containing protein [Devosia sp. ZB163]MDC9823722.1 DUF1902 domain-containing protein [Devosia sp. ZB163]